MQRKFKIGWGILLAFILTELTTGCTVMERLRGDPMEGPSAKAVQTIQRRTNELESLEAQAGTGAPLELGSARVLLDEIKYFYGKKDYDEVRRLDAAMGESLDSIRDVLQAGGWEQSKKITLLEEQKTALEEENRRLRSEVSSNGSGQKELKEEIQALKALSEIEMQSLSRRLAAVEKDRDDAIQEVVRTRSRIEGLASDAGASAMFAEARVLVDRMEEEAFTLRARRLLEQGQNYLTSGKKELDAGNSGGAAYLFDLVSSLFQEFRNSDPKKLTVAVRQAGMHRSASASSAKVGFLSRGEAVEGIKKSTDWVQVRDSSGRVGWVRDFQVH